MYIMNFYLIDVHSSKYRVAVFDMHNFHAILTGENDFYAFIDVL